MRKLFQILLIGGFGSFAGCNEFVAPPERTAAIDVVGEPTDPTTESLGEPDILGSLAPSLPDDIASRTDSSTEQLMPQPFPDDEFAPGSDTPDVNGEMGIVKPVSLKTTSSDSASPK